MIRKQLDPEYCSTWVYPDRGMHHQCTRHPWRDGYCKQHHPETAKKRNAEGAARYKAQRAAEIARYKAWGNEYLHAEVKRLLALLEEASNYIDTSMCPPDMMGRIDTALRGDSHD